MDPKHAYDIWAAQYDTNLNRTRDLEAKALRTVLAEIPFRNCLEIGCGTGKNTEWLLEQAAHVSAVDFSVEMLAKAREKITSERVLFVQADITQPWAFGAEHYDLVSFSLVLEHIENLEAVFKEVAKALVPGGYVYLGELHPFKQYSGSKARFDTEKGLQIVTCYTHHISDFVQAAKQHGLAVVDINEFFDNNDRAEIPRILTLLLRKV
ncbi:class I SAM-dependent methyltransferase [Pontibacter sp. E15-1]|uniref:class I SAM-dependent methyltransferase n=1 Tax=Pontibacter sp. E15-1 TaxID=2919918 RepID=UPI001F4FDEBB|nr:class I SAM-dependent methyltransferase [Pontibacter sp. E15-1]MCJ8164485.1 class I SAM-dependent methyltransferase [Pontibacter sp. E15-1]